ncbi:hypothetical protein CsSME_00045865 [Camellia sinensis var. sinensis]
MEPINTSLHLEYKGRVYPIRVFEEQSTEEVCISCKGMNSNATDKDVCSNINGVLPLPAKTNLVNEDADKAADVASVSNVALRDLASRMKVRTKLADGGSWSHASAVEETKDCAGISNEEGTGVVESTLPAESLHKRQYNHDTQKGVEAQFVETCNKK